MERIGRHGTAVGHVRRRLAMLAVSVLVAGIATPVSSAEPAVPGPEFEVVGDEISGWWWLRDATGGQDASWVFAELPPGGEVLLDLELLATDTSSGGRGVDAAVWLQVGPVVDGERLDAIMAPALLVLPNISPPEDPVGYTTRGTFGFPMAALTPGSGAPDQREAPGPVGLWVTLGRLGPDGAVLPDHIAVREASVQRRDGAGE